jgi:predicted metal-dependent HD superfamily phosphohydrolase
MLPAERFSTLWRQLGATDDGSVALASLESAYGEPHRSYHTASHIVACLRLFDQFRSEAARPNEVEVALWFHDAVYDPRARDNEERTACMACELMEASGIAPDVAGRVADMIRATREHEVSTPDTALVIDIDLAILATPPEEFARFEAGIKREFEWVENEIYRATRAAVLRRFLDRPVIYATPALRDRFEAPARANLRRLIDSLASGPGRS